MNAFLSLCAIALAIAVCQAKMYCPADMNDFTCTPYKHDAVCMSDGSYICGNCFAEKFACENTDQNIEPVLNRKEAQTKCRGDKPDCMDTREEQTRLFGARRGPNGQWY